MGADENEILARLYKGYEHMFVAKYPVQDAKNWPLIFLIGKLPGGTDFTREEEEEYMQGFLLMRPANPTAQVFATEPFFTYTKYGDTNMGGSYIVLPDRSVLVCSFGHGEGYVHHQPLSMDGRDYFAREGEFSDSQYQ
jgi:hypothetical protein